MTTFPLERALSVPLALCLVAIGAPFAVGETQQLQNVRAISIDDAFRMAESRSDALVVAPASLDQARGRRLQALSPRLPRLNAYSTYDRSLKSEFDGLMGFGGDTTVSDEEAPAIPFGSANTYRAGLTAS